MGPTAADVTTDRLLLLQPAAPPWPLELRQRPLHAVTFHVNINHEFQKLKFHKQSLAWKAQKSDMSPIVLVLIFKAFGKFWKFWAC